MNYSTYILSLKEKILSLGQWLGICGLFAYFFYRSWIAFGVLLLLCPLYLKWKRRELCSRRKWQMTLEFREAVIMVAANLQTGNSIENAFRKTYVDLKQLYGDDGYMVKEFQGIGRGLDNNFAIEELLMDLGERSGVDDISDFADIFRVAKRSGGNLREIMSDTADLISQKTEMKRELRILISEKQFEQKIMCVIPFFILMYIGISSPGYFDTLYHNFSGIIIMSGCLLAYVIALFWGFKITRIEV